MGEGRLYSNLKPHNPTTILQLTTITLNMLAKVDPTLCTQDLQPATNNRHPTTFIRLAKVDPTLCAQKLPSAFHTLVPNLCAEQDGVRFGTAQVCGGWDLVVVLAAQVGGG